MGCNLSTTIVLQTVGYCKTFRSDPAVHIIYLLLLLEVE